MRHTPNDDDPLDQRYSRLLDLFFQGRNVGPELLVLADQAASQAEQAVLACKAYGNAAQSFLFHSQFLRAKVAISRARVLARQGNLPAYQAGLAMLESQVSDALGDHAGAARTLISLLKSKLGEHLQPRHRIMLFRALAEMCSVTDPGDTLDLCLSLGDAAWRSSAGPLPVLWLSALAQLRLHQYTWSDPRFAGRLRPIKLDPIQRSELLSSALEVIERAGAACRNSKDERVDASHVESARLVLSGLTTHSVSDVWKSLRGLEGLEQPATFAVKARNRAAYAFHMLERPDFARQVLQRNTPDELGKAHWHARLEQMYLQALTSEVLGHSAQALGLYRTYAIETSQRMEHMDLGLRDALKTLTELQGGRPQDQRDRVPGYMRRAQELLQQDPVNIDVSALALAVGVSERTLRSAFQVHCGVTPKVYTTRLRLDAAKRHVESCVGTPPTVTELAEQFGFSHPGRFAAAYARHHGKRPGGRNA